MAFLLQKTYQAYIYSMTEGADFRVNDYPLMTSPLPVLILLGLWYKFVTNWGPEYMKNREPFNLKSVIIFFNLVQVFANAYIACNEIFAWTVKDWHCSLVDRNDNYWGEKHSHFVYCYFLLKLSDLLDTIFFVLRKKDRNVSFLHIYHHFLMVIIGWSLVKHIGGEHSFSLLLANSIVHVVMYIYYLLTAYDRKYGQIKALKKFITQIQIIQMVFLIWRFLKPFYSDCKFPKKYVIIFMPQTVFMLILFSEFYIRNYILQSKKFTNEKKAESK